MTQSLNTLATAFATMHGKLILSNADAATSIAALFLTGQKGAGSINAHTLVTAASKLLK